MTLLSFACISAEAPLYAIEVASAMAGENAMMKSSLCLIRDCCATSVYTVRTWTLNGERLDKLFSTICQIHQAEALRA